MQLVGLTGGIASGKSTVAEALVDLGAVLVDADVISREVVEPGEPAYDKIVERYGREILQTGSRAIDRDELRRVAFATVQEKKALESIIHPAVSSRMAELIQLAVANNPDATVVLDVPLLFETGADGMVEVVIVVYATEEQQTTRLMARDGLDRDEAERMVSLQMPLDEKCKRADWVVWNAGSIEQTTLQTEIIWEQLKERSSKAGF